MESPSTSQSSSEHREISVAQIQSNENVRKHFDVDKLKQLSKSIKEKGVLQPLIVRPHPSKNNRFQIVVGERRWRAAKLADLAEVPCIVRELTDDHVEEIQLIENDQREDLTPLERAAGYQKLLDHGYTPEKLALTLSRSTSFVYSALKLLALPQAGRDALERGEISVSTAELIARIPNADLKEKAAREIVRENYTGAPLSSRLAQAHIERHYVRELKGAPFDQSATKLVPKAGSCETCPKRTGNNRRDFPEGRADICTDTACFLEKVAAAEKLTRVTPQSKPVTMSPDRKASPSAAVDDMRARLSDGKRKRASELAQRLMFLLRHYEGMSYDEIAAAMNCSPGTVKKGVSRAIAKLRVKLDTNTDEPERLTRLVEC